MCPQMHKLVNLQVLEDIQEDEDQEQDEENDSEPGLMKGFLSFTPMVFHRRVSLYSLPFGGISMALKKLDKEASGYLLRHKPMPTIGEGLRNMQDIFGNHHHKDRCVIQ